MFCSFCNNEIGKGTGTMFVYKNGEYAVFCSSKCHKNLLKLKREGRLQKWTSKTVALVHEKEEKKKQESFLSKQIEEKLAEKAGHKPEAAKAPEKK